MKQTKNTNKLLIIIFSIIFVILLTIIIILLAKDEYLENKYDDNVLIKNNNSNSESKSDISDSNDYISQDKALQVALDSLNLKQSDIYDLSIELDYKYNSDVYEIDFKYNYYEYEFYINAKTGEILKSFSERD